MPTIMIPGKDKDEAEQRAKREEARILKEQHADLGFLLCRHGEKDWNGADPCCAFDKDGKFRERNWSCFLMGKVRELMGQWADNPNDVPGHYWWDDDQNYGVLYIHSWLYGKPVNSHLRGVFVLLDWYKSRGATDNFRILSGNTIRGGTEDDAKEIVRIYHSSKPKARMEVNEDRRNS